MRKVTGSPRFNAIMLGELRVDRLGQGDTITMKFGYVDAETGQMFGMATLPGQPIMSSRTKELLSQLVAALEDDAAVVLFREATTTTQEEGAGIHHEPAGLADEAEEGNQI